MRQALLAPGAADASGGLHEMCQALLAPVNRRNRFCMSSEQHTPNAPSSASAWGGKKARLVLVEMFWLISFYIDGCIVKDKMNILSLSHALGGLEPCNYMGLCQEVWLEVYDIRRREHMAMKKSDTSFVSFGIFHHYDREEFQ